MKLSVTIELSEKNTKLMTKLFSPDNITYLCNEFVDNGIQDFITTLSCVKEDFEEIFVEVE